MPQDYRLTLCNLIGQSGTVTDQVLNSALEQFQTKLANYKKVTDAKVLELQNSVNSLKSKADKVDTLTATNATLVTNNKSLTEALVENDLKEFAPVIQNAAEVKTQLLNNRTATIATLKSLKPAAATQPPKPPLHNSRNNATPPAIGEGTVANSDGKMENFNQQQVAVIMNRARMLQAGNKMLNFQSAVMMARGEFTTAAATA